MEKDFAKWHELKTKLQARNKEVYFRERDIWFCSIGINLGHEEDGKHEQFLRPVIIFKKFDDDTFWGIPLTSRPSTGVRYFQIFFNGRISTAMLSQMRIFDKKRFIRKVGEVSEVDFNGLKSKLRRMMQ
jgi:mRNA-degrading endonuclease toxin of MazEF toxin-antitoxin module